MAPQPGMFLREQAQCDAIRANMNNDYFFAKGYHNCLLRTLRLARKYPNFKYVLERLKEEEEGFR